MNCIWDPHLVKLRRLAGTGLHHSCAFPRDATYSPGPSWYCNPPGIAMFPVQRQQQVARQCWSRGVDRRHGTVAERSPSAGRKPTAREVAVGQLLRVDLEGAFVGRMGSQQKPRLKHSKVADLTPVEQRVVTDYVAQVTRFRRRLDWRLEQLSGRPIAKIDPVMLQILRLGIYEVMEAKLPPHAISSYVDLAKTLIGSWAGGFANDSSLLVARAIHYCVECSKFVFLGVLRSARRAMDAGNLMLPPKPGSSASDYEKAEALGVIYSHPTWMVLRWLSRFGEQETEELLLANNRIPHHGLRANTLKGFSAAELLAAIDMAGTLAKPSQFLPDEFLQVTSGLQHVLRTGLQDNGSCMVQDEAAGLVVALLDPQPGESILDACAAPGGKTLFTAARMRNQGCLVALDVNAKRQQALLRAAQNCGVGTMLSVQAGRVQDFASGEFIETCSIAGSALQEAQPASELVGAGQRSCKADAGSNYVAGWGLSDHYEAELDEFYGTESSIVGILNSWSKDTRSAPNTATADLQVLEDKCSSSDGEESTDEDDAGYLFDEVPSGTSATRRGRSDFVDSSALSKGENGLQRFDRVLLDVPCSGLGVLAKRADLRWRRKPEDLEQLLQLQAELMNAAAELVKPGGLLLYSTCSIEREENEGQIEDFAAAHPEYSIEAAPEGKLPEAVITQEGFLATMPHVHGIDGAFSARLRRKL